MTSDFLKKCASILDCKQDLIIDNVPASHEYTCVYHKLFGNAYKRSSLQNYHMALHNEVNNGSYRGAVLAIWFHQTAKKSLYCKDFSLSLFPHWALRQEEEYDNNLISSDDPYYVKEQFLPISCCRFWRWPRPLQVVRIIFYMSLLDFASDMMIMFKYGHDILEGTHYDYKPVSINAKWWFYMVIVKEIGLSLYATRKISDEAFYILKKEHLNWD